MNYDVSIDLKKKKLVGKLVREEMKCFKILETKGRNYINEN